MLLNCGVGEESWESLGLQGDPSSWSWIFIGGTDTETPILWLPDAKICLIWKDLDAGKVLRWDKGTDDRGWDGWMASLTWWTWVSASFGSWSWTWKPRVLQSMGSQRGRHYWVTELVIYYFSHFLCKSGIQFHRISQRDILQVNYGHPLKSL